MKNRDLHQLLRAWAARHEPDAGRLQDLAARAVLSAGRQPLARAVPAVADRPSRPWWPHLLSAAAGAAAACLAMVLLGHWRQPAPPAGPASTTEAALPDLNAPGQTEAVLLYKPIDELFGGRLLWLVESDRDIRLGLPENGAPAPRSAGVVVVRTVVLTRSGPGGAWRRLWEVTAAARAEEPLDTTLEDARVALWAYPLPDGGVAVDSALELQQPVALSVNASNVFLSAKPLRVLSLQTETAEYQVLQVVWQVSAEQGGA
jgi:hypothetical protein